MKQPISRRHLLRFAVGLGLVAGTTGYVGITGLDYQRRRTRRWVIAFDGNQISSDAQGMLQTAIDDARTRPDQPIRVVGHTGTVGGLEAKRNQSEQRAQNIRDMLVQAGIDERRIDTAALSDQAPLAQVEGESRRAYERRLQRVEILIGSGG